MFYKNKLLVIMAIKGFAYLSINSITSLDIPLIYSLKSGGVIYIPDAII